MITTKTFLHVEFLCFVLELPFVLRLMSACVLNKMFSSPSYP